MTTTLYVDSRLTVDELASLVAAVVGSAAAYRCISTGWGELDVGDDARAVELVTDDPDDFLNWPYYIATSPGPGVSAGSFL